MISCKYISFLQDFVNFKGWKNRLKEGSKGAFNEGKFVLNINVLFALLVL
jgi:hypothetical protein